VSSISEHYLLEEREDCSVLHLISADQMNRLTRSRIQALTDLLTIVAGDVVSSLSRDKPLIITGNHHYFSVGADLNEVRSLSAAEAFEFAKRGQKLFNLIAGFPVPVCAAISGYCFGGGLDLALACHVRICAPNAVFGHRGAALGFMTGWGGTQRLPSIVGRARATQMFVAAEKLSAAEALDAGLVREIAPDPLAKAIEFTTATRRHGQNAEC
jgi:enoyl-CoA hydratase/carnithine racemase